MQRLTERHPLQRGSHPSRDDGMCAMEMVAWLAGEAHSDEPECACPVLASLVRACNDAMTDDDRNRVLRPLVPQLVQTRAGAEVERQRGLVAIDGMVRSLLPLWLERRGDREGAARLRSMAAIECQQDVGPAWQVVTELASSQRAANWVLQLAEQGTAPVGFVTGVAQLARGLHGANAWSRVGAIVRRMIRVGTVDGGGADYRCRTVRSPAW